MIDVNESEKQAIQAAAERAGELLDTMPAHTHEWDEAQFMALVETICTGYVDSLIAQNVAVQNAMQKVAK